MSNTQLTQTGAQVQADLNRIESLPTPTSADSGKYLGVNSNGNFALISATPSGYTVTITNGLSADHDVVLYDGQDNTGTYLGVLSVNTSDSYTITSGYIYAEWDNPLTTGDVTFAESGSDIGNPIQVTSDMSIEVWDVEPVVPYLTFSSPSSFTLNISDHKKYWNGTLEYSTNATNWNTWSGTTTLSSSSSGDTKVLYLRGRNNTYITGSKVDPAGVNPYGVWVLTGSNISCEGNIENLLNYQTVTNGGHPTMASYCYQGMFQNCTSLITAPELPATTLSDTCYAFMFYGCISLTTAPAILPATTLTSCCYYHMFNRCSSLTTAPSLSATTLADRCCYYMFVQCTSLTTAPSLPATTLANQCYNGMFSGCTSLATAPTLPATTLADYCYSTMFNGCTKLTTPAIMAGGTTQATPAKNSCENMYYGCTALNIYTSSNGHMPFYVAMTYSTSYSATNYHSSYRMFYNCYIDGSTSTKSYLTAGTQYYY